MPFVFNPDDDWQYIVIKETVTVVPWVNEAYDTGLQFTCDAYSYDRTSTDDEEDVEKEECGWVLRRSQVPNLSYITQNTLIIDEDDTQWLISGEIKLLTKKSRFVVTGIKTDIDLTPDGVDPFGILTESGLQLLTESGVALITES